MAKSLRQKEINFLAVLEGRTARQKRSLGFYIAPGILALLVLLGVGVFALFQFNTGIVQDQTTEIRSYLNSSAVTRQVAETQNLKTQSVSMQGKADAAALPMDNLASYPDLTSADYARILEMAGANVDLSTMSFDRTTGILAFTATSDYVLSIPTFISQLRNSGLVSDVSYTGYVGSRSSQLSSATTRGTTGTTGTNAAASTTGSATSASSYLPQVLRYTFSVECSIQPVDRTPAPAPTDGQGADAGAEAPAETGGA